MERSLMGHNLVESEFAVRLNKFATKFFNIINGAKNENFVFSPFTLANALGLTLIASRGDTRKEISEALQLDSRDEDLFHNDCGKVSDKRVQFHSKTITFLHQLLDVYVLIVNYSRKYELKLINKLLTCENEEPLEEFTKMARKFYGTNVERLDFNEKNAVSDINQWMKHQTNNKIDHIVDNFESTTKLVLINVMYFRTTFANRFEEKDIKITPFYNNGNKDQIKEVPMMSATKMQLNYRELSIDNVPVQIVELPFLGDISMFIILPRELNGLKSLSDTISYEELKPCFKKYQKQSVDICIPRFFCHSSIDLMEPLKQMGVKKAFEDGADFSGIHRNSNVKLSQAKHKTVFEMCNDEGEPIPEIDSMHFVPRFVANHPFLFVVRDTINNIPLLIGKILTF
ncbi:hypothetical protein B4U79_17210 [Dinothrombium tinctorium]|uniref:Serpin domain-containing protein n=1 Tax=Dinothrombium tinctorium TaxID=1965070 RepID=A0A3S3PI09_9ACAR|nr:hypothetical protein B4U79_17210 [Dinothrombium tinctorium]